MIKLWVNGLLEDLHCGKLETFGYIMDVLGILGCIMQIPDFLFNDLFNQQCDFISKWFYGELVYFSIGFSMSRDFDCIKDLKKDLNVWKIPFRVLDSWIVTASNGNRHMELIIGDTKVREVIFDLVTWCLCNGSSVICSFSSSTMYFVFSV